MFTVEGYPEARVESFSVPRSWICVAVLALGLFAASQQEGVVEAGAAWTRTVEARPGADVSQVLEYTTGSDGTLFVWAASSTLDPRLRLEKPDGTVLGANENGGGGSTACIALEIAAGQPIRIVIEAPGVAEAGLIDVHVDEAPETADTRRAADTTRAQLAAAQKFLAKGDLAGARASSTDCEKALTDAPGSATSAQVAGVRDQLGFLAHSAGDLAVASRVRHALLLFRERYLPPDHPDLAWARSNLAWTFMRLRDLVGARNLQRAVLDVRSRTLPDDHPDLQWARANYAWAIKELGDLQGARELEQKVLEVRTRTLPEDDLDLAWARANYAWTISKLGSLAEARGLQEKVLASRLRALHPDHPDVQWARKNLAWTRLCMGDTTGSRQLQEQAVEVFARLYPEDSPDQQSLRSDLAVTLWVLGDLRRAQDLHEKLLASRLRVLPEDHIDVRATRGNLALTLRALGDLHAALALEERVLDVDTRLHPDDEARLLSERENLAGTLWELGERERAMEMIAHVLERRTALLPDDHIDLLRARVSMLTFLSTLDQPEVAEPLLEKILTTRSSDVPADHPFLLDARQCQATMLSRAGRFAEARAVAADVLQKQEARYPPDHLNVVRARVGVLWNLVQMEEAEEAARANRRLYESLQLGLRSAVLLASPREVEALASSLRWRLAAALSFAQGAGRIEPMPGFEAPSLELVESARGVGLRSLRSLRDSAADSPAVAALRAESRAASGDIVRLSWTGADSAEYLEAVGRKDRAERALRTSSGLLESARPATCAAIAAALAPRQVAVAYWWYPRLQLDEADPSATRWTESLLAFVLRPDGAVVRVELGPAATIARAVERWREAVLAATPRGLDAAAASGEDARAAGDDARAAGEELRRLVIDPLRASCGDATEWIVALDDVLHLVPIDALPDGDGLVGDKLRIHVRPTLSELVEDAPGRPQALRLLVLGGIDYESAPDAVAGTVAPVYAAAGPAAATSTPRAAAWERGFTPLPDSRAEARTVEALFTSTFADEGTALLLDGRAATKSAFCTELGTARFLHLATHGYFAPESVPSMRDATAAEAGPSGKAEASGGSVRGFSPMVLCGLALAGANRPPDALGRLEGVITAEELAALDLSGCELAVLSACDTNVGVRRAGQGVASFQTALHSAGARSVITSLWKVPDEATKELMVDFYRRIWVQEKPKAQALWEAKKRLRDARTPAGQPIYRLRDWAGWQLSGEPD